MKSSLLKSLAVTSTLSLALVGCSSDSTEAGGAAAQSSDGVLDLAISYVPGSLDPGISAWSNFSVPLAPGYASLLETDVDNNLAPGLAEEWTVLEDGKAFEFTLREDQTFADETPLDAEAVVASLEYWGEAGGPYSSHFEAVESIEAVDELTVRLELQSPNEGFLYLFTPDYLAGLIISPAGLEDPQALGVTPQGAGPYVLNGSETVSGNVYVYDRNPHYYAADDVEWDSVRIQVYQDSNSALQALNTGSVDVMYTDAITANSIQGSVGEEVQETASRRFWTGMMIMDREGTADEALADVRVRQALNYAVDRQAVSDALFGDYGAPTDQVVAEGFTGFSEEYADHYDYNPEKARELLAEAGYADGIVLSNALLQTPRNQRLSEALSGQLSEVGVALETSSFANLADWRSQIYTKEYGITVEGNQFFPSPYLAQRTTLDPHAPFLGVHALEDTAMAELIEEATMASEDEAEGAWQEVFTHAVDEAWFVPVAASDAVYFYGPAVGEIGESPNEIGVLDIPQAGD